MIPPSPDKPHPTLLLVDDEPTILASINESLRHDYRTRVAADGQRAIELAFADPPPDLIVLDVEMPVPTATKSAASSRTTRARATPRSSSSPPTATSPTSRADSSWAPSITSRNRC